jgi:broad specificity phosphatase PhoE
MPKPILYYVRHGLTEWNVQQRLQGRLDIPLNPVGRSQAQRCGAILRELFARDGRSTGDFTYVSSPLGRARETMELVRATLGLPAVDYEVDERLAEIAFGDWEGLTYEDVLARDGDVVSKRENDKWGFLPPGGESYAQVTARVGAWYDQLDRDAVVAAHGGTARALLAHLEIAPPDEATHQPIDQGVVYVYAGNRLARYA